jgi:hypothetical protein
MSQIWRVAAILVPATLLVANAGLAAQASSPTILAQSLPDVIDTTPVANPRDGGSAIGSWDALISEWQAAKRRCAILDIGTLSACFASAEAYDVFAFEADVTCSSTSTCCPRDTEGLMRLAGAQAKLLAGNGHTLRRVAGQATCPAIQLLRTKKHHGGSA